MSDAGKTPALSIQQLRKTYKGGFEALRGIDLTVRQGEFFALLGPNGAGKSTTIGIVSTLVNKTSGRVRIFGHDIDAEPGRAKRLLGLVPQEFNFSQFEPVEEILINQAGYYGIPRREARQRARHYLDQLGLSDKRRVETRQLSGGMKRRMMIARAIMHEPPLLILDEPTAGVDIEVRRSMWRYLQRLNEQGATIILTTHNLEEAENLCRHVAIIDRGEIIRDTPMKQLLATLDGETFILDLAQPLEQSPTLPGVELSLVDPQTLEVQIDKRYGLNRLFCELQNQGVEVQSLRNKYNRLEELFLNLVGHVTE